MPAGQSYSVIPRGVGLPDYSAAKPVGQVPIGPIYTSSDVGELAVRLGSPVIFDRRGNVIFLDDFENGLARWLPTATGVGASISLSTAHYFTGARSLKLVTGTDGPPNGSCEIDCELVNPEVSRLGIFAAFTIPYGGLGPECQHLWRADVLSGTFKSQFSVRYTRSLAAGTGILEVLRMGPAVTDWQVFAEDSILRRSDYLFHVGKMVFDIETGRYVRFILDGREYDLTTYNVPQDPDTSPPRLHMYFRLSNEIALNQTGYLDNIIITQNEPPNTL